MSVAVMMFILVGLLAAMATTFAQLRASLDTPSCPECPHCQERARQERAREELDRLRLEDRIADYQDPEGRDRPWPDR